MGVGEGERSGDCGGESGRARDRAVEKSEGMGKFDESGRINGV